MRVVGMLMMIHIPIDIPFLPVPFSLPRLVVVIPVVVLSPVSSQSCVAVLIDAHIFVRALVRLVTNLATLVTRARESFAFAAGFTIGLAGRRISSLAGLGAFLAFWTF